MSVSRALEAAVLAAFLLPGSAHAADHYPTASPPESSEPSNAPPALRVSVDPAIDDAALLPQWLAERNPTVGPAIALPGHEQWIAVEITGATYDYRVIVTAIRDGEPLEPIAKPLACECNSESLLALIDHEIADAIERLRSFAPANEPARAETEPETEPQPEPTTTVTPPPRLWQLSRLGIAGVATGAFGLLAIGGGVSLLVAEEREIPGRTKYDRELDPLGYTVLSVGLAALAGGVAMVVIDGARLHRNHDRLGRPRSSTDGAARSAAPRRTTLSPILDRHALGAALTGRF